MLRILITILLAQAASFGAEPLADARRHLEEGRYAEAAAAAGEVDARDPAFAKAQYLKGEVELLLGDPEAAAASFRAADQARPGSAPILTALGRALLANDDAEGAQAVLGRAVKADPKSGRARGFLGLARHHAEFGQKGRGDVLKGLKLAPGDPELVRAVVLWAIEEGDLKLAGRAVRGLAKKRKDHPMGPFLDGLIHERAKDYDEAIKAYEKALKRDDTFLDAHKNLAILCIAQNPMYTNKKRTEKAMTHFERYFALGGKDPEVKRVHATLKAFLAQR